MLDQHPLFMRIKRGRKIRLTTRNERMKFFSSLSDEEQIRILKCVWNTPQQQPRELRLESSEQESVVMSSRQPRDRDVDERKGD